MKIQSIRGLAALVLAAGSVLPAVAITAKASAAGLAPPLTRYPYLTDVVGGNATVNFGTDQTKISAVVKWGQAGVESCTAHTTTVTKTNLSVNGVGEYQWKAQLSPLQPDTAYCYRPYFGTAQIDLLGSDPAPQFVTQLPAGSAKAFSFAVLGDWGKTYASGNPDQANLMAQIAASGARFAVASGDAGYPAGSQASYGDLEQTGQDISAVFGPQFWTVVGKSVPMFHSIGNHAPTTTFLTNWPSDAVVAASGGTYQMESYCCVDGITTKTYERLVRLRPGHRPLLHPRCGLGRCQCRNGQPVPGRLRRALGARGAARRVHLAGQRPGRPPGPAEVRGLPLPAAL
jgi:hypothetical protein